MIEMDEEPESLRQTYQLCWLAFAILFTSLLLACPSWLLALCAQMIMFGAAPPGWLIWIADQSWWRWLGTPVVWGSLAGSYLLWGRWSDPGWQRRVGLLIAMGLVDVVLWGLEHGEALALHRVDIGHRWLRSHIGEALGWAEFALIASLAGDVMAHFGVASAREASKSTRSLAATGAVVWMLLFCQRTDWSRGWPLLARPRIDSLETALLQLGTTMISTITLIQVTALTFAATRETSRGLKELDREEQAVDPFGFPPPPPEPKSDRLSVASDAKNRGRQDSFDPFDDA
jgi:hypothetical protein